MIRPFNSIIQTLPIMSVDEPVEQQTPSKRVNYKVEFTLSLLVIAGCLFILGDIDISALLSNTSFLLSDKIVKLELSSTAGYSNMLQQVKLSDVIGIIILSWSLKLILIRLRHRLVAAFILPDECPECGSYLTRKDRTVVERLLTKCLMLNSMSCYCAECDEKNLIFRYKVKASA